MKKTLSLLILTLFAQSVFAQDWNELSYLQKRLKSSKADTGRINILLKMAEFEIFKPGEYKIDLDSAAVFVKEATILNQSVRSPEAEGYIVIEESYLAKDHEDRKTGKMLMEKSIQQLSKTGNKYLLATAYQGLADYYDYLKPVEVRQKIKYLQTAADIYGSGGYVEQEAFCYKNLSEIIQDDDLAYKRLDKAYTLYISIGYKKLQGVYDIYSQYYLDKSDFKQALRYGLIALKTAQDQNDHSGTLTEIENHIGIIYNKLRDNENQVRFFTMGIQSAKNNGDIPGMVLLTLNVANSYLAVKEPLKAKQLLNSLSKYDLSRASLDNVTTFYRCELRDYMMLKEYGIAKQASIKLIGLLKSDALWAQTKGDGYVELAFYYLEIRQYADAKKYLLINDQLIKKLPSLANFSIANGLWFGLDTATHDYKSAVYHAVLQKKFSDSLYKLNRSEEIQRLQIQFDTREKENQIAILNQKAKLQQANLNQATFFRNVTFGGIALALTIALLLFRQSRQRKKNNNLISQKNQLLQNLVTEKEWLLKEVHHRVKNNLHTVICLLESQAAYLENDALQAIENSQHRIYAMSLIHQKLYQSDSIQTINMALYLNEFITYLTESFGSPGDISIQSHFQELELSPSQAIPLGLIINEAVTNAFKYAFPFTKYGIIAIELKEVKGIIELIIVDNGIGMSFSKHNGEANSLGMELMKGLTRDLKGEIIFEGNNGTKITVSFVADPFTKTNQLLPNPSEYILE